MKPKFEMGQIVYCPHMDIKVEVKFVHNIYNPNLYSCVDRAGKRFAFTEKELKFTGETR